MQTTFTVDNPICQLGQIADGTSVKEEVAYVAAEAIPFGRMVELDATGTKVQLPQGSTVNAIAKPVGVSIYDATKEPDTVGGGYKIGEVVRVLRKGRIYAEFSGTTDAALTSANVFHSSTIATNRGKFTDTAGNAGVGVEVDSQNLAKFVRPINASQAGACLVELNLP